MFSAVFLQWKPSQSRQQDREVLFLFGGQSAQIWRPGSAL